MPVIEEGNFSCGVSNSDERRGKMDGKRTAVLSEFQARKCYSGETITDEIQPSGLRESADTLHSDASSNEVIGDQFSEERGHQEASEDLQQTSRRLDERKTRVRSLSPASDSSGGKERPAFTCEFYASGWCNKGNTHIRDPITRHDKKPVLDAAKMKRKLADGEGTTGRPASDAFSGFGPSVVRYGESQMNSDNELRMYKLEHWSNMPYRDTGRETLGSKSYLDGYGSSSSLLLKDDSLNKDSYHRGMLLSSSVPSSDKYQNTEVPPYTSGLDDMSYKRTQLMLDYYRNPSLNSSVERWPLYRTSCSNLDPFGDQKLLGYCSSRSISLQNKSSALPGPGTDTFSWTDLSGDIGNSCDYKTRMYLDDWEPSVPFQPSTLLSRIIPRPETLYDPIRDSIEQPRSTEKDLPANDRRIANRSLDHQENMNTSPKEQNHSRSVDPRGQKRGQLERLRHSYDFDTVFKREGSVNYESEVMKNFRAALVEFVKELLKPTWHEGLLNRDAYKVIVKKASDKVVNSLQPDQIPDTTESIKQYLSVSKSKVAKLIEGYVEIYGKS